MQEIPENGADIHHLPELHADLVVKALQPLGVKHGWTCDWQCNDGAAVNSDGSEREDICRDKHVATIKLTEAVTVGRITLPGSVVGACPHSLSSASQATCPDLCA